MIIYDSPNWLGQYIRAFNEAKEMKFSIKDGESNKAMIKFNYSRLISSLSYAPAMEIDTHFSCVDREDPLDFLLRLVDDQALLSFVNAMRAHTNVTDRYPYSLIKYNERTLLATFAMPKLQSDWFKDQHYQFGIVFKHPIELQEIGFTINVNRGITFIREPNRIELYPSYRIHSISDLGYTPMTYFDLNEDKISKYKIYNPDGSPRRLTEWEKFRGGDGGGG